MMRISFGRVIGAASLATLLLAVAPPRARAQMDSREGIALQNQILQLRRDVQVLGQQVNSGGGGRPSYPSYPPQSGGGGGGGEIATQLLDRVSGLEDQVRRLQGRIDEIDNAQRRQYDDLTKQIGDLSFRMQAGGAGGAPANAGPGPSSLGTAPPGPPPAGPPPRRTPELMLQEGNAALARRDYPAAEASAREVLAGPRSPRAIDGQFLLAQSLAGQRNFQQAAVAFDDAYRRSPSGTHAADSLLGLANSLNALNAKRESCQALDELRTAFPSPRPDLRDQVIAARGRAGCR